MNTFGPDQYTHVGNYELEWKGPVSIHEKIKTENPNNLFLKYVHPQCRDIILYSDLHIKHCDLDKNIYNKIDAKYYEKKYWCDSITLKPMKYGRMKKELSLGINSIYDQGIIFSAQSFKDDWINCFITTELKYIIYMQQTSMCLYKNPYSRVYRVKFPNDAKIVVYNVKGECYWKSDKIILEEIPSDKYIEYLINNFILFNKALTDEENSKYLSYN